MLFLGWSLASQIAAACRKTLARCWPRVVPGLPPTGAAGVGSLNPTPGALLLKITICPSWADAKPAVPSRTANAVAMRWRRMLFELPAEGDSRGGGHGAFGRRFLRRWLGRGVLQSLVTGLAGGGGRAVRVRRREHDVHEASLEIHRDRTVGAHDLDETLGGPAGHLLEPRLPGRFGAGCRHGGWKIGLRYLPGLLPVRLLRTYHAAHSNQSRQRERAHTAQTGLHHGILL